MQTTRLAKSAAFAVAIVLVFISVMAALARDSGQWEGSDLAIQQWFQGLKQPDNPTVSCCGKADAYWADKVDVEGDKVFATITDTRPDEPLGRAHVAPGTRIEVPPHKLKWDNGNPTGHNVIFLNLVGDVLCFVQSSGV